MTTYVCVFLGYSANHKLAFYSISLYAWCKSSIVGFLGWFRRDQYYMGSSLASKTCFIYPIIVR